MATMDVEAALRDLTAALAAGESERRGDVRLRAARQVLVDRCGAALEIGASTRLSVPAVIRLAVEAAAQPARRVCAVLVVHALAVPGLVPEASAGDVCTLVESALPGVLLRCGYPFGASLEARLRLLERLHATIAELMHPMEPTFPGWIQGLHAG
jgi:hypothetical protein